MTQCDEYKEGMLVLGDMNAKDDEMRGVCQEVKLQEARYAGASWGVKGNKFYADVPCSGFGLRKDRVLFPKRRVWGVLVCRTFSSRMQSLMSVIRSGYEV